MKKLIIGLILFLMMAGCSSAKTVESNVIEQTKITTEQSTESTENESTAIETTIIESETTSVDNVSTSVIPAQELEIPNDGKLVRIIDYIPDAYIDLQYATEKNFMGQVLYDDAEAYLCYGTVKKLIQVQNELRDNGYSILIWDAYRTPEAQQRLWNAYPDPTFVADPRNGLTSHSQGNTVDIAFVHSDGSKVEFPSAFDEFSNAADRNYSDVSEEAANNASLLEEIMYKNGFTGYAGEWWDYSDTSNYTLEPVSLSVSDYGDEYLTNFLLSNNYKYSDISDSEQLIVVDSDASNCEVYCYEKTDNCWICQHSATGILGKNGVALDKKEGDYCTPKGLFSLGFAFGTENIDTKIDFRLINDNCYWVDDSKSAYYNQWVESCEIDWDSAEHLIDYPQSYHYGIVINYNTDPIVQYAGSAIFLHCMSGAYTAGCVAIPEEDIIYILKWLNNENQPIIIIE